MPAPTITDQEFRESTDNRERMYEVELHRVPVEATSVMERTFMDRLGRGRWPVDYITARQAGYSHAEAMQVERVRIRAAAGLPATEPMPAPPTPPTPIPPPPTDVPGVRDNMQRFAVFYKNRCARLNFRPDQTSTRESRILFLQETVLEFRATFPLEKLFYMKRASDTRPISDEVVVWLEVSPDYRRFWDFLASGGSADWHVKTSSGELGSGEILETSQPIVDPRTLNTMPG